MDFKSVLDFILKGFEKENVRYAVIGGFALGALGAPRATLDLDFLIEKDDVQKVENIMKSSGYECVYRSDNVSQYVSAAAVFGEVDFLHAFRAISRTMLGRAREMAVFDGKIKIKVLRAEDIIGLKVQAAANAPDRRVRELLDIEALMEQYRGALDWKILEEYFSLFGEKEKFLQLKTRYAH